MSNTIQGYVEVNSASEENNIIIEISSVINEIKNRPKFQGLIKNILKKVRHQSQLKLIDLLGIPLCRIVYLKEKFNLFDLTYLTILKLISLTFSSIAEFETTRRKEWQMQGISTAKKASRYQERKTIIDDNLISKVKDLK